MVLFAALFLPVAIGPLLRGCWDLWAQTLVAAAVLVGTFLWLVSVVLGRKFFCPAPSLRSLWISAISALVLHRLSGREDLADLARSRAARYYPRVFGAAAVPI